MEFQYAVRNCKSPYLIDLVCVPLYRDKVNKLTYDPMFIGGVIRIVHDRSPS